MEVYSDEILMWDTGVGILETQKWMNPVMLT